MNLLTPVSALMSIDLKTVSPGDSLLMVRDIFQKHNIHHIPVVRFKEIVGMISKTDYLYFRQGCVGETESKEADQLQKWKVEEIMTNKLAKVDVDEPLRTVVDLFKLNRFHALPIIENGELVGIITPHDIITALADEKIELADYQSVKTK